MIIEIHEHSFDMIIIRNNFFIVMCICVRGPTLARLAMVSVLVSLEIVLLDGIIRKHLLNQTDLRPQKMINRSTLFSIY